MGESVDRDGRLNWFAITFALASLWALWVIQWVKTGWAGYQSLAVMTVILSSMTMALDISRFDGWEADVPDKFWLLGALLAWLVVMPVYLIKRRQSMD